MACGVVLRKETSHITEISHDYIVMGDFTDVVGEGTEDGYAHHYGLGYFNDRGRTLVDFCKRIQMYVTNTWFTEDRRQKRCLIKLLMRKFSKGK